MNKTIEITISPKGESRIETSGFTGEGCRAASSFMEAALGKVASEKLKPEFHEQCSAQNSVKNSN